MSRLFTAGLRATLVGMKSKGTRVDLVIVGSSGLARTVQAALDEIPWAADVLVDEGLGGGSFILTNQATMSSLGSPAAPEKPDAPPR